MAGIRSFLAIDLEPAARAAAGALLRRLRAVPGGERVRWTRAEALHVTLRFLGDIEPERVGPVVHQVARETAGLEPFALELDGVHLFPSPRRPRVVALGLVPEEPVLALAAAVERAAVAAGFAPEARPFRPHLTLGRLRGGRAPELGDLLPAPPEGGPAPVVTAVHEVVLFRSQLGPGGSRYTPLGRMSLGGPDSSPNQAS